MPDVKILQGDCVAKLRELPEVSMQMCVTSPPYWGLRDYGVAGQIGLEETPEAYVQRLVEVFHEVKRVLRDDGLLWLNLGDSYTGSGKGGNPECGKQSTNKGSQTIGVLYGKIGESARQAAASNVSRRLCSKYGMKPKDLVGIPWLVAFALREDGWYLRSDIIWHKPNPMPESVLDRPTKSHEYIFLLSKNAKYFYDAEAISEQSVGTEYDRTQRPENRMNGADSLVIGRGQEVAGASLGVGTETRNKRSVWTVPTCSYAEAHFATFPPALIKPCILAGSKPGDTILDCFGGSGTSGQVALELGRNAVLIELNPDYCKLIEHRTRQSALL